MNQLQSFSSCFVLNLSFFLILNQIDLNPNKSYLLFCILSPCLFFTLTHPRPEQWEYLFWFDVPLQQVFSFHKSNERHVHRQTQCHQSNSDQLPGLQWKTETSENLAHICFLWRRSTKVMKSPSVARRRREIRGREGIKGQCGSNNRAIDKPSSIWSLALENTIFKFPPLVKGSYLMKADTSFRPGHHQLLADFKLESSHVFNM